METRRLNQDLENKAVIDGGLIPLGYRQITNLSTAQPLPDIPNGARLALIVAEFAPVAWRDDGVDPTSSVGMPMQPNVPFPYNGDLSAIRFIAKSGSPILHVNYYG